MATTVEEKETPLHVGKVDLRDEIQLLVSKPKYLVFFIKISLASVDVSELRCCKDYYLYCKDRGRGPVALIFTAINLSFRLP